jgi:GT2 family glycosyltransferase
VIRNGPGVVARLRQPRDHTSDEAAGRVQVLEVEVTGSLPDRTGGPVQGGSGHYVGAKALIRVHGVPVALAGITLEPEGMSADQLAQVLTREVLHAVNAHLVRDAAPPWACISPDAVDVVPCAAWREPVATTTISVVIPTIGRREQLEACLDALLSQRGAEPFLEQGGLEIIVVDNRPHLPQAREVVRSLTGSSIPVRWVAEPRPGVAYARNRGLEEAHGRLVAFVDDDTVVDSRWLRAVLSAFDQAPTARCVTGLVLPSEQDTPAQHFFEQYGGFDKGFSQVVHHRDARFGHGPIYPYLPGVYGTGASAAFDADWFRAQGGFDVVLGGGARSIGGEDIEAFLRVVLAGEVLVYEPQALAWHAPHRDMDGLRRQVFVYGRGLSAVLTKAAVQDVAGAAGVARRLPSGLRFMLSGKSGKNNGKTTDYPRDLTRRERVGFLVGPFHYLLARVARSWHDRRQA